jgi:hypothetical protein
MPTRVIHFGPDDCHRRMVLQTAGYSVDECHSLSELRARLLSGAALDAVLMSDVEGLAPEDAATLARMHCCVPVVLFRGTNLSYEDSEFDLVIHALTPPDVWLNEVDALIEKSRAARDGSKVLTGRSIELPGGSKIAIRSDAA